MVGSAKKDKRGSTESTARMLATPERFRIARHLLVAPWPEWNDEDINTEKWDSGFDVYSPRSMPSTSGTGFDNLAGKCLPPSILVHDWKRALSVNPKFQILPEGKSAAVDLDLISSNGHILHSEFMRHIVTSIMNLHHLAAMKPFDEMSGNNFVPNGPRYWKPWSHVYAMCKVGKGTKHKPSVNKFGKYIIRLYLLGQWRRITVDDFVPMDEFGRVLLPMTSKDELWPILLSKALIQIASLTWTPKKEVVDFNAITCLTGWFMLNIECERVPPEDVWSVCQKALMNEAEEGARYKEKQRQTDIYQLGTKSQISLRAAYRNRRESLAMVTSAGMEESWGTVAVFAEMASLDGDLEEEVGEIGPCVGHQVLFSEARIIRLYDDGGPLPLWKTFRWKKWALKMGIIEPDHLVNVKSLRMFAPLKKWLVPIPESSSKLFNEMTLKYEMEKEKTKLENEHQKTDKEKRNRKRNGKNKGKGAGKAEEKGNSETKSIKSGNNSANSKAVSQGLNEAKATKVDTELLENTDPWMNFNVFSKYVISLQLFLRTSSFKYCKSTNDFQTFLKENVKESHQKNAKNENGVEGKKIGKSGKGGKGEKGGKKVKENISKNLLVAKRSSMQQQRQKISYSNHKVLRPKNYFYLVSDSPYAKKIFLTMGVISPNAIAEQNSIVEIVEQEDPKTFSVIIKPYIQSQEFQLSPSDHQILTVGSKSRFIPLREGRVILIIWVNLPEHHFLQIVSQTEFTVGNVDMVNEILGKPSMSLVMFGSLVYNSFEKLKTCELGSIEHAQALEQYHKAYLPDSLASSFTTSKHLAKLLNSIRKSFEEACTFLLYNRLKNDFDQFYKSLRELQELMRAPKYGLQPLQNMSTEFHELVVLREEKIASLHEESELSSEMQETPPKAGDDLTETVKGKKGKKTGNKNGKENATKTKKGKNNAEVKAAEKPMADKKAKIKDKKRKSSKPVQLEESSAKKKSSRIETQNIIFTNQVISAMEVMRKIVEIQPELLKYYPFRHDLRQRIAHIEFSGSSVVSADGDWSPLARLVVNVSHDGVTHNDICLTSSVALAFLRITDNETLEEKCPMMSNFKRDVYRRNTYGYTIFAYGFCDNMNIKEHSWKIQILANDANELLQCCSGDDPITGIHISSPSPPLTVKHVYGHYIPNNSRSVLRCLLTVHCSQMLTIRLNMSCPDAEIVVRILTDASEYESEVQLLYEKTFTGKVTLPSLPFLVEKPEGEEESKPAVFLVDADLAGNGWELTELEELLVTDIKEKVQRSLLVFSKQECKMPSIERRKGMLAVKNTPTSQEILPNAAYWCAQVVVDAELESTVQLKINNRKEMEIRKMKATWEEQEPGRHIRASKERQRILGEREEEKRQKGVTFAKTENFQSLQLREAGYKREQLEQWKITAEDYGIEQQEKRRKEREEYSIRMEEAAGKYANVCVDQKITNDKLRQYLLDCEKASNMLIEDGYQMRDACLSKPVKNVPENSKKEKVKKDGKKKGKAKKKNN